MKYEYIGNNDSARFHQRSRGGGRFADPYWLINIGRKLQTLDWLAAEIRDSVRPDIKDVCERLSLLEGKTASLFGSSSPLQLRQSGRQLLESSGLKRYIDSNKDDLLEAVFNAADSQTEYDIQAATLQILNELDFDRPLQGKIKQAAFNAASLKKSFFFLAQSICAIWRWRARAPLLLYRLSRFIWRRKAQMARSIAATA